MLPKRGKSQLDRSEICTEVSFTTAEVMRTLIMKLPHTEVKFYPEVKCQTGLSSLRVSCKRALINYPRPEELLNKRSELISKCRHANKFLLRNYKTKH